MKSQRAGKSSLPCPLHEEEETFLVRSRRGRLLEEKPRRLRDPKRRLVYLTLRGKKGCGGGSNKGKLQV